MYVSFITVYYIILKQNGGLIKVLNMHSIISMDSDLC